MLNLSLYLSQIYIELNQIESFKFVSNDLDSIWNEYEILLIISDWVQ